MFDVIVVGGGPAGLSAALMLGRCRRRVLVCDEGGPRNARSRALHGYLTRDGVAPRDFNALACEELQKYAVEFRSIGVHNASRAGERFIVSMSDGSEESSRFLLIATGVVDTLPEIAGLKECYGQSVFHCPYCDGWEWQGKGIGVLGADSSAARLALSLRTWSDDVALCMHGSRLAPPWRGRLERNGVALRTEGILRLEHVGGRLHALALERGEPFKRDVLFFPSRPRLRDNLAMSLGCAVNRKGTVNTGNLSDTNVPGVFVAGDASRDVQFVVIAAAEGVKAAVAINQELQRQELKR